MNAQLQAGTLCWGWKKLVQCHPFLMRVIDFGNPERFPLSSAVGRILTMAGSRVRTLRICTWKFPFPLLGLAGPMKSEVVLALVRTCRTLEHLILVGHIPQGPQTRFPQVDIRWIMNLFSRRPSVYISQSKPVLVP